MKLKDTVDLMLSDKYDDRLAAEYQQLDIRIEKLEKMLEKYKNDELDFKPACSYDLLHTQLVHMKCYLNTLEVRADLEEIDIDN